MPAMNWIVMAMLLGASLVLMMLEWRGVRTTLSLEFKGDVKRETRFIAQYGQLFCSIIVAVLLWQLDHRRGAPPVMLGAVFGVSVLAMLLKRLLGRVRPNRENAGRFLGFSLKHNNYRESFPSSHSASAMAMSVVLAQLYPPAAVTFYVLAAACGALRYVLDAHWPSDVLAGLAMGIAAGNLAVMLYPM
jgi:membrane-associated phospholipid phosphatase